MKTSETHLFDLNEWSSLESRGKLSIVMAAGFEPRAKALLIKIMERGTPSIVNLFILDYSDSRTNRESMPQVLAIADKMISSENIHSFKDPKELSGLLKLSSVDGTRLVLDVSAMSRIHIFGLLHAILGLDIPFDISYTEAMKYHPDKEFYDQLHAQSTLRKTIFDIYESLEKKEVIYSYDCEVISPYEFRGNIEPGRDANLIAFLTFKRARLQSIIRTFEFSSRLVVIGEPVREDLKWRKELMKFVNSDIIKNRPPKTICLPTLYPLITSRTIETEIYSNPVFRKGNIYLAPLGSKMQTLGSYLLWHRNQYIRVVFSQPHKYFPEKYTEGWKDTFFIPHEVVLDYLKSPVEALIE